MKLKLAALSILLCAGCATKTGVVPIGDGIYMMSTEDYMSTSGGRVKAQLYTEAAQFCTKLGKRSVPVADTANNYSMHGYASAEVKFRCE